MRKKLAVLQSNYIPWKGYFDIISSADQFIFYDHVQYTKNDWRNRNRIKTKNGIRWITIPVRIESLHQSIAESRVSLSTWAKKHWRTLEMNYSKAPFFGEFAPYFERFYAECKSDYLSEINQSLIKIVCDLLEIRTPLHKSSEFCMQGDPSAKLLSLCQQTESTIYLSGPSAKNYLDLERFREAKIEVEWMDYSGYKKYPQLYPPFEHAVTVLDLIFNTGGNARRYLNSYGKLINETIDSQHTV